MSSTLTHLIHFIVTFSVILFPTSAESSSPTYNVATLGAKPDGNTDSSDALLSAWNAACGSSGRPTIYVPQGQFLVRKAITFTGSKCMNNGVNFVINGTLVAPSDFRVLRNSKTWFTFYEVDGLTISGGVLDGQGAALWTCKKDHKAHCPTGLTSLELINSKNIEIKGLTSVNSQMFHIVVYGCKNVKMENVRVSAPGSSPNTDGIHVQSSSGVTILDTDVATGDDCVSLGPGTTNMWMENINCGPGHGISIGSLGRELDEPGVENITVKTATFTGTQNGVRIKSWGRPSKCFVHNVLFQHITMVNAQNPIIIDQNYCPGNKNCPQEVSGVRISNVTYQDIHGSSATEVAVKFDCSSKHHCRDVRLDNVKLTYNQRKATSSCKNVGTRNGLDMPSCL